MLKELAKLPPPDQKVMLLIELGPAEERYQRADVGIEQAIAAPDEKEPVRQKERATNGR